MWMRRNVPVFVAALVIAAVVSHSAAAGLRSSQLAACERGKVNSAALAKVSAARATYLRKVLAAVSVKNDVKRAATVDLVTERHAAMLLWARSHADCPTLYPAPGWVPGA